MKLLFKEEQRFTQWWIWLILVTLGFLLLYGIFKQLVIGEQFGDKKISDTGLILIAVIVFCLIALFRIARLKTEIDDKEIRMHFFHS